MARIGQDIHRIGGHEDDAFGTREHQLQRLQVLGVQAEVLEGHDALVAVEDAQHDVLAVRGRLRRDAEVDLVAGEHERPLGQAPVIGAADEGVQVGVAAAVSVHFED